MALMTPKLKAVFEYIQATIKENGYAPTYVEIMDAFGFRSVATASKYVKRLAREGYIYRHPGRHRGIEILEPDVNPGPDSGVVTLPLMGLIVAGSPLEKIVQDEWIHVPQRMVRKDETFVLEVRGDSMIDDHILDRDLVIVENRQIAHNGEIVVAEIDHEVTLKRYRKKGDQIILEPANPTHTSIIAQADHVLIHGVVTGLIRRFM